MRPFRRARIFLIVISCCFMLFTAFFANSFCYFMLFFLLFHVFLPGRLLFLVGGAGGGGPGAPSAFRRNMSKNPGGRRFGRRPLLPSLGVTAPNRLLDTLVGGQVQLIIQSNGRF
jgi:hypothetical protein